MKIGLIGTGNMGAALARAMQRSSLQPTLLLANRTAEKAQKLAAQLGGTVVTNEEAAAQSDFLFLGVKPQGLAALLDTLQSSLSARKIPPVLVSMAAGIDTEWLRQHLKTPCPCIRIMPNTPVSVGQGVILYTAVDTSAQQLSDFRALLCEAGEVLFLEETKFDAASAISGCGPAYCYAFADALAMGGVRCGLPYETALRLAAATLRGSAELLLQSGEHPAVLMTKVCSPAGTTIEGVAALRAGGFESAVSDAVTAACARSASLAKK